MSVSRRSSSARALVRVAVLAAVLASAHPATSLSAGQSTTDKPVNSADLVLMPASSPEDVEVKHEDLEVPLTEAAARPMRKRASEPGADASKSGRAKQRGTATDEPGANEPQVVAHLTSRRTQDFGLLGVTWDAGTAGDDLVVEVRTRTNEAWTSWEVLDIEDMREGEAELVREGTEPAWVGQSDGVAVRLLSAHAVPSAVRVELIDGGSGLAKPVRLERAGNEQIALMSAEAAAEPSPTAGPTPTQDGAEDTGSASTSTTGGVPQPRIVTRRQWGVDASTEVACSAPTTSSTMKGIVLHHTAGANGYSQEESPGIVRGIHRYHTKSLGWCDLGYNFLVDAYGTIYQGRRGGILKQVRGAHAGNWDANMYTTGISMMGNYDTVDVPTALRQAVVRLSAWRLDAFGLRATGKITIGGGTLDVISAHRDIYKAGIRPATATACPGRYGYAWLNGTMRSDVQKVIDAGPAASPSPTPKPSPSDGWEDLPEEPEAAKPTPTPTLTPTPTPTPTPAPTPTPLPTPTPEPAPVPMGSRLSGGDRYATAAAISAKNFTNRGGAVFLAAGKSYADALSGGPAAAGQAAPVLLSRPGQLPTETVAELERLAPTRIYILGGEGALSADVEAQAAAYAEKVVRLAGVDRYDTGVVISRALWSRADSVYLSSGVDYPDALSGGALAARKRSPLLLAGPTGLSDAVVAELSRLNPQRIILLGGTNAVSEDVQAQAAQAVPGATVTRLSGKNRYVTSAVIADAGWRHADLAYFAAATDFPDALAGVPAAALHGAPLLLTKEACVPRPIGRVANSLNPNERVLLGGFAVLQDSASSAPC